MTDPKRVFLDRLQAVGEAYRALRVQNLGRTATAGTHLASHELDNEVNWEQWDQWDQWGNWDQYVWDNT